MRSSRADAAATPLRIPVSSLVLDQLPSQPLPSARAMSFTVDPEVTTPGRPWKVPPPSEISTMTDPSSRATRRSGSGLPPTSFAISSFGTNPRACGNGLLSDGNSHSSSDSWKPAKTSGRPSPVKSATATRHGQSPCVGTLWGVKFPFWSW